jgi:hypothetical protein
LDPHLFDSSSLENWANNDIKGTYSSVSEEGHLVQSNQKGRLLEIFQAVHKQVTDSKTALPAETYTRLRGKCTVLMNKAMGAEGTIKRFFKSLGAKIYAAFTGDSVEKQYDLLQSKLQELSSQQAVSTAQQTQMVAMTQQGHQIDMSAILAHIGMAPALLSQQEPKNFPYLQERRRPPEGGGFNDQMRIRANGKAKNQDRGRNLFRDHDEIIKKENILSAEPVQEGAAVFARFTMHKKPIILQQGVSGCTAAAAAMLIMDAGGKPSIRELLNRNLGFDDNIMTDIREAKLNPINTETGKNLKELRELLIKNNSSAIVSVGGEADNHVLVVDAISKDLSQVRVRDPFHGWEITVTAEAFLRRWHGGKAIQIVGSSR